jgi:PAS domain-containing protein
MGLIQRRQISKNLIEKLAGALQEGESAVVIGPRRTGKNLLLEGVAEKLREAGLAPHLCSFHREAPMQRETEIVETMREQIPVIAEKTSTIRSVFQDLKSASSFEGKPVTLFLARLDGVASEVARRILREIRPAVVSDPPSLVVLITGESDIVNLVRGPDSEFNCSHEFLVQGLDQELYGEYFTKWADRVGMTATGRREAGDHLWNCTRGNISLLRRFVQTWLDGTVSGEIELDEPLSVRRIDSILDELVNLGIHGAISFQWAAELISSEPDCLQSLERLIADDFLRVSTSEPATLELAGVAVFQQGSLYFSSPVMRAFIKTHFHLRHIADLYAQANRWDEAFEHYSRVLSPEVRPIGFQDGLAVSSILAGLATEFQRIAWHPLKQYLVKSTTGILGFEYSGWWRLNPDGQWEPQSSVETYQRRFVEAALSEAVPASIEIPGGTVVKIGKVGLAVIVPGLQPGSREACVVGDLFSFMEISFARNTHLAALFRQFVLANDSKLTLIRDTRSRKLSRSLARVGTDAYRKLFVESLGPLDVLQGAAEGLYKTGQDNPELGFSRVFCCWASDDEPIIEVVSVRPEVSSMKDIRWSTTGDNLVSRCLTIGDQMVTRTEWPEADRGLRGEWGEKDAIAVPLIIEDRRVGVLCVTYEPSVSPLEDDLKLFKHLATQLSAAIEQGQRVAALRAALNQIPEPIVLFDRAIRKRYANAQAAAILQLQPDWCSEDETSVDSPLQPFITLLRSAWQKKQRLVQFTDRVGVQEYRAAVLADVLMDSGTPIGVLLHLQDESYYRQILEAYRSLAESKSESEAFERLQISFEKLGHRWMRKYHIESECLVLDSWIERGISVPIPVVKLTQTADAGISWRCIRERRPIVSCYDPSRCQAEEFFTERGLMVIAQNHPVEADKLNKTPNDYWIDFPLTRNKQAFGKLTMPCEATLSPERFEMFCVFAEMAGDIFSRLLRSSEAPAQLDLSMNILEEIQPLDVAHAFYEGLVEFDAIDGTTLKKATDEFKDVLVKVRTVLEKHRSADAD